ncbi:hypothetical protein HER10_EVM0006735 [Colletotrichum scovillei]|uniref:2og-fe oxygenase superfamily protein n=1 Tax=Colletotrichum scovillei TaxID=1209932 RepID=A0A9P7R9C1_9PEZI|nr:uncharacterized protein HER10_EVM0006735 [Colletotrichum scovillei]KAF4782030.1 hypothetical protein HER10_EVM0006735 [Colletotrichum scovillei]KAG7050849.1 2og-fe oxygenase superfamily protein [Colletotrichum scovillei]KAG7069890.1 2og-fe oxygenase superfamily protein [Colletotrichum scovillei]KAG7073853.1 2og-fe oxygenase superfamily protein [Colletotrichum scovillei]
MSDPEPAPPRSGILHGTNAPLSSAFRAELYQAIEALYAVGGGPDTSHAIKSETESYPTTTEQHSASSHAIDAAYGRLTDILQHWDSRIQDRSLSLQHAIYHFHTPKNPMEFESWVMGQNMSAADSTLVTRLIDLCPRLGFEVLPVVMKYTGKHCQYQAWISFQRDGNAGSQPPEQNGFWQVNQHISHLPSIGYFGSFDDFTLAENINCHAGNVLDERNILWERARRSIFSWQWPSEERAFHEERTYRETNPQWYQHIVPGTSGDLGHYFAPAIIITPLRTQLDSVNITHQPQLAGNLWRYLLRQCKESSESAFYFEVLKSLCQFVWPQYGNELSETQILGLRVRSREDFIGKIDPGLMGDLILTSLAFNDHPLFQNLVANTRSKPIVDYDWICQNAIFHGYSAAHALYELRHFLSEGNSFLQVASIVEKLPAYAEANSSSRDTQELGIMAIRMLEAPLSASHGRLIVNLLELFKDFGTWRDTVDAAVSRLGETQQRSQFILGLFNRLFEVAKRHKLPLDQVTEFYEKHAGMTGASRTLWNVENLVSNANKEQSTEAKAARQAWCVAEPTEEFLHDLSKPGLTNHTMIAGLLRNLDRLGMNDQVSDLTTHIAQHVNEIQPIHLAPLWLPLLKTLQDVVDPDKPAYQRLFQAIFVYYESAVFEDVSGRIEREPKSIPPMAECCSHCKTLNSFFEQPSWKTIHLVKPRAIVDHIQGQLNKQDKPIKAAIYGKNEASLTMQLTKFSLVNERIRTTERLRRQEATRAVHQFDPDALLSFLGDKGGIMWKLGDAESQGPLTSTAAGPSASSSASVTAEPSRPSLTSTPSIPLGPLETPQRGYHESPNRNDLPPCNSVVHTQTTPKVEDVEMANIVKPEPEPTAVSTARRSGHRDIREMFGASVKKEKSTTTPSSSSSQHAAPVSSSTLARDRLKNLGRIKLESTPKFDDKATARLRAKLDTRLTPRETPRESKFDSGVSRMRDPLAPFGGGGSRKEPISSFSRRAGLTGTSEAMSSLQSTPDEPSKTPRLDAMMGGPTPKPTPRLNALSGGYSNSSRLGLGVRPRSPSSSPSPATGNGTQPDYMAAILDAERSKKRRTGSTWEVRSVSGNIMGSGTASSAANRSRFSGLVDASQQENPRLTSLMNEKSPPRSRSGIGGGARTSSRALTARSHNVRPGQTRISGTVPPKRQMEDNDDEDVIDLCGDDGPSLRGRLGGGGEASGGSKRVKTTPVFNLLDDDPFGED